MSTIGACIAVMLASASVAAPQSAEKLSFGPGQPVPAGNVVKGQHVFDAICWACHSHDLSGGKAPPLTGPKFYKVWQGKSVEALSDFIRNSMPRDDPGSLSEPMARDVVAYIVAHANNPGDSTRAHTGK
jgi:mono/diheme cytochrome c family protein